MAYLAEEKKAEALGKFREGCTWAEVSMATGVSNRTLFRWASLDPEFSRQIKEAGSDADAEVEAVTYALAIDPDPAHNTLRMFWLNARKGYKQRSDVTSEDKQLHSPVVILPAKEMHASDVQTPAGATDSVPGE